MEHIIERYKRGLCIVLMPWLLASCDKDHNPQPEPPQLVKSMVVSKADQGFYREYPARVNPGESVDLAFEVSGRIIALPVKAGDQIKKGQLIARINPQDYQNRVDEMVAKDNFAYAQYERFRRLLISETVSQADFDEKLAAYKVTKANLKTAEKALHDTHLTAPFDGIIGETFVDNHQYIQAKESIASLQDLTDIELLIYIPEEDVAQSGTIQKFHVDEIERVGTATFTAIPGEKFPVKVKEFSTTADPKTQTFEVKLLLKRPERQIILPGMSANVAVKFKSDLKTTYLIPVNAVGTDKNGQRFIWVINEKTMTAKKTPVSVGEMFDDKISVSEGIQVGERIVTAGVAYLTDGQKIRIIKNNHEDET